MSGERTRGRWVAVRNSAIALAGAVVAFALIFGLRWFGLPPLVAALSGAGLPGEGATRVATFGLSAAILVVSGLLVVVAALWWLRSRSRLRLALLVGAGSVWFVLNGIVAAVGRYASNLHSRETLAADLERAGVDPRAASDWAATLVGASFASWFIGLIAVGFLAVGIFRGATLRR